MNTSLRLNLAGYSKDEIAISYDPISEYLYIKADNKDYGKTQKTIYVPENLSEYINAKYTNGILTISVLEPERKPISIKIT